MDTQSSQLYDEHATRHLAAYNAFSVIFEAQNARPQLVRISRDMVSLLIVIALAIVMIAAIIVSGSRTIAEFTVDNPLIGITAFVMVEGGIMAYAFFRARRSANKERLQGTLRWATIGLVLTVIVGLGANVDSTLRVHNVYLPQEIRTFLNLLVAVSAPALAFISSDVLAIELMATDIKRREAQKEYETALNAWQEKLNASWRSKQRDWGVKIQVAVPTLSNGIPLESNGILPAKSTLGHTKKPDAAKRVRDYLAENPEAINGNPLEIAAFLEVGKSTVYNVLKDMRSDQ